MNGQKFLGYAFAGGLLLLLADVAPGIAMGTAGLILLAATLNNAGQLTAAANFVQQYTGTQKKGQ